MVPAEVAAVAVTRWARVTHSSADGGQAGAVSEGSTPEEAETSQKSVIRQRSG